MQLINIYKYIQIILVTALTIFLIYFEYPTIHTLIILSIAIGILYVTKFRSMIIGMYMGATDTKLQRMMQFPFQLYNVKPKDSEEEEDPMEDYWLGGKDGEA